MKIIFESDKRITAEINGFEVHMDQSTKSGGLGEYPNPFDTYKVSIGGCMSFYVMAFCLERNIPLDSVWVEVDFKENENIESITTTINVSEEFPEKYMKAVERLANNCKIKRAFASPPKFTTQVVRENK